MVILRGEDARAVINEIMQAHPSARISNLPAQKILYFLHGEYLRSTDTPLVSGYFEAWEYGPVHPMLYNALRHLGSSALSGPIKRRNIRQGMWEDIPVIGDNNIKNFIAERSGRLLTMSVGQLIDLSHARNSPWDIVTRNGSGRTWGLRLDNDIISRHFRFHKRSVTDLVSGDDFEEHPPSGD
jgi:uncharacterized phage-associated protein